MSNFPIDESYLVAVILEAAIWGLYTSAFILFLIIMYGKKKTSDRYNITNVAACLMYLIATLHLSLAIRRAVEAFVLYRSDIDPVDYYAPGSDFHAGLNAAKEFLYAFNTIIGDSIVVWRCNAVWGRRYFWVTAVPALLVCLSAIGGIVGPAIQQTPNPDSNVLVALGALLFFCSFLTNIIVTILIGGRIWWITRASANGLSSGLSRFGPILVLIIESGLLISVAKITEFALFFQAPDDGGAGNNGLYIVFESVPQIVGLVPTLIIIAVAQGYTNTSSRGSPVVHTPSLPTSSGTPGNSNSRTGGTGTNSAIVFAPRNNRNRDSAFLSTMDERQTQQSYKMDELASMADSSGVKTQMSEFDPYKHEDGYPSREKRRMMGYGYRSDKNSKPLPLLEARTSDDDDLKGEDV